MSAPTIAELVTQSRELIAACQAERLALAAAYAPLKRTVAPLEQPSAGWLAGREREERVCGCRVRRYFSETGG